MSAIVLATNGDAGADERLDHPSILHVACPHRLILLSLLPIVGGAARLTQLTAGAEITPQNQRFFDTPVPVYIHIVTVTVYVLLGAFQFVPALRVHAWHRRAGRISAVSGLLAASSGLWLAVTYFLAKAGPVLLGVRLVIGLSMVVSIALGLSVIVRSRDIIRHGAWMTRAYAIGAAAGTEAALSIAPEVLAGPSEGARQIGLTTAAWVINLAVAEWVIRRRGRLPRPLRKPALPAHRGSHRQRSMIPAGPFQLGTDLQRLGLQSVAGAPLHRLRDRLFRSHGGKLALGLRPGTDLVKLGPGNPVLTAKPGDLASAWPVRESDDQLTNPSVETSSHADDPRRHPRPSTGTVHETLSQNRQHQLSTKVETHPSTKL
jgi:hypothetical protein